MDFYFKFEKIKTPPFVDIKPASSNEKIPARFNTRYREPKYWH
jgi:hypothetical protein